MPVARSGPDPSASLHLVVGAEPAVLVRTLEKIRKAHGVREGDTDWEEVHLDGSDVGLEELHGALAGRSLFAPNRLVLIRRAEELDTEVREALLSLAEPVPPGVVLIVATQRVDAALARLKGFEGAQTWELAPPTRGGELARWVQELATAEGLTLSPQAVQRLVEATGGEAALLPNELAKLAAYASEGDEITPADVDALASTAWPGLPRFAVFDLVDAVSRGDAAAALERFRTLMRRGEEPLRILGMLGRQWHLLAMVRGLRSEGKGRPEDVERAAGVKPFEARKLLQLAVHWDDPRLARAVEWTAEADLEIKRGAPAPTTLEVLVLRLSRLSGGSRRRLGVR